MFSSGLAEESVSWGRSKTDNPRQNHILQPSLPGAAEAATNYSRTHRTLLFAAPVYGQTPRKYPRVLEHYSPSQSLGSVGVFGRQIRPSCCQCWPILVELGQRLATVDLVRSNPTQAWPSLNKICQTMAEMSGWHAKITQFNLVNMLPSLTNFSQSLAQFGGRRAASSQIKAPGSICRVASESARGVSAGTSAPERKLRVFVEFLVAASAAVSGSECRPNFEQMTAT